MTRLENTAETGIANGTGVTVANSDDGTAGDAFSVITIGGSGTIEYEATGAHSGSQAIEFVVSSTNAAHAAKFGDDAGPMAGTTMACRFYLQFTTLPSANLTIARILNSSGAAASQFRVTSAGLPIVMNNGGTALYTGPTALTTGTLYRVEWWSTPGTGTSNGRVGLDVYVGDDTASPIASYTATTVNGGSVNAARSVSIGKPTGTMTATFQIDDLAIDDGIGETFIGPYALPAMGTFQIDAVAASSFEPLAARQAEATIAAASAMSTAPLATRIGAMTSAAASASSFAPLAQRQAAMTVAAIAGQSFTAADPYASMTIAATSTVTMAPLAQRIAQAIIAATSTSSMAPLAQRIAGVSADATSGVALAPLATRLASGTVVVVSSASFAPITPAKGAVVYYRGTVIDRAYHLGDEVVLR